MRMKRTLKLYVELFRNPRALFNGGSDDTGAKVILFPNGEKEIWIQDDKGNGYRITASRGPFGFGLQVSAFVGSNPITVIPDTDDNVKHVSLCQYDSTPKAQAFKSAYLSGQPGALDTFHKEWDGKDEWFS